MADRQPSLADTAVQCLAAVSKMSDGVELEHDERHDIRSLKQAAEKALADAFHMAWTLVYLAESIRAAAQERRDEAKKRAR